MQAKECIAMILAGGQGSRLGVLTKRIAKPAVPFGGKYRIIDFALSNCYNSGIDTVGVLTQYQPLQLHTYIGIGSSWDLDRKSGGVFVLPPFVRQKGGEWYKGTANAIYQNADFIDEFDPSYVLVLSGDHIYKMDYSLLLEHHKKQGADVTIAVIEVPWEETYRFGIMNTDKNLRITEFEEKPKHAKNNLASMGVYIFNWQVLKRYLSDDEHDLKSEHDFGKNIIPKMLDGGLHLSAYPFKSYWKDVGTVESLWEANMDLLGDETGLDLSDDRWRIYSVNPVQPPHYIGLKAKVQASLINEGCQVYGQVEHSVLFPGVEISEGAVVRDSVIMTGAKIASGSFIENAIVGERVVLEEGVRISGRREPNGQIKIALVEEDRVITAESQYRAMSASL